MRFRGVFGARPGIDPRTWAAVQPIYFTQLLAAAAGGGVIGAGGMGSDGALVLASRLAREPDDRAAVALVRGNRAAGAGRFAEAEKLYLEAAELAPPQPVALRNLAMLLLRERRHARALEVIEKLHREAPKSAEAAELAAARRYLEGKRGDKR